MSTPDLRVLSLGAGVQSTTLLLMALDREIEQPDLAIFADTGWEPAAVYEQLERLAKRCQDAGLPLYRVNNGDIRSDSLNGTNHERMAMPLYTPSEKREGRLLRKCTSIYKIAPITAKIREILGVKPRHRVKAQVEQWYGISLDEVYRMRENRTPWIRNRYPLIDAKMTRWDCILWLRERGYPEPPKSACLGCPFHSDRYWRDMRDHRPDEWRDATEFDAAIRHSAAGAKQPIYLHRSLTPLAAVDLSTPEDRGQLTLFDDFTEECEGMCGV